jgi:hypothetical protein
LNRLAALDFGMRARLYLTPAVITPLLFSAAPMGIWIWQGREATL